MAAVCKPDDVAGIDDRRGAALAGLEANDDVLVEIGLAARRRLCRRDRLTLHVGERFAEISDEPLFLGPTVADGHEPPIG